MKKKPIYPYFFISLFSLAIFPLPLLYFSPFLAILYRKSSLIKSLWVSALCGLILDLLSASPFGLHAFVGAAITILLYRYHIYFIDKPIGLASYTILISTVTTLLSRLSLLFYDPTFPWTWGGAVTDFVFLPLFDGCYSLLCFSFPFILYRFCKKRFLFIIARRKTRSFRAEMNGAK